MKDDLRDLYQEVILDHGRRPRNLRFLPGANRQAHGHNPMCGDAFTVFLKVDKVGHVREVTFVGHGCAISVASASMMTEMLTGKSEAEARALFHAFQAMCTGTGETNDLLKAGMDGLHLQDERERLKVLSGVRQFPVRVKCATLAWHTMVAAVDGTETASTE